MSDEIMGRTLLQSQLNVQQRASMGHRCEASVGGRGKRVEKETQEGIVQCTQHT